MKFRTLSILTLALLSGSAQAQLSCTSSSNLVHGGFYPLGTFFKAEVACSYTGTHLDFQWAPPAEGFWGFPAAWRFLTGQFDGLGGQVVELGCSQPNCENPGVYQFNYIVFTNPCDIISREQLGKNIKLKKTGPNRIQINGKWVQGPIHVETCAAPPTSSPDGNPINSPKDPCLDATAGHPVNLSTGSMWHQQTNFVVKGRTPQTNLEITRTYTANAAVQAGGFGPNWRHNYETHLQARPGGDILWIDEGGGPYLFLKQGDGSFLAPAGSRLTFTEFSDRFELKRPDRTVYVFSKGGGTQYGKLQSLTERHGESLNFAYDSLGRLAMVSSPFAGSITFSYNETNLITQIHRDRDNLSYHYTYAPNLRLTSATDYRGRTYSFSYVAKDINQYSEGMLESITDPLGRELRFTYDESGRARQQYEPGGGMWDFTYGDRQTSVKAPNGAVTRYFFDENYREVKRINPDGSTVRSEWENGLRKNSCPDFGGKTKYSYDQNGNVASIQRPEDPSPKQITYNLDFNVPTLEQPIVGAPTQYTLDPNTGDVLGMARGGLSLAFTRDPFGNLLSTSNGRATYSDQRDQNGLLTHVFDAHNPETRTYDQRGRIATRQFLSGRTLSYSYNDDDLETLVVDSHGPTTARTFDLMNRLVRIDVSASGVTQTTLMEYDSKDRLVSSTDALGRKTEFIYDRIKVREKPIAEKDPAGRFTYFEYDSMDRLVKRTDARGAETRFTYDQRGNMTSVTDANGQVTSYAFDRNDRKIVEKRPSVAGTAPVTRTQLFFYNPADRLVREVMKSATGGADRAVNYEFDALDRLVRRVVQREGATNIVEDDSSFSFENQLDATLMKTAANGVASLGFEYGATRPFSLSEFSVAASASGNPLRLIEGNFQIGRDVTGEVASVSKNGSSIFQRSFDAAGRLISAASGDFTSSILHDGFGRRQTVSHSSGATGNFQYDLLNRVISVSWTGPTPISEALGYDLAGNITYLERENTSYQVGYDEVNQLVSSISTGTNLYNRNFAFDLLGNRIGSNVDGPGAFVNNFLTGNSTSSFLADPDGFGETVRETTAGVLTNFAYRADGLLNGVQKGTLQAGYFFDALNRRVAKTINTGSEAFTQSFLHLGLEDRILQAKAGNGAITTYVDGKGVDEHLFEVQSGVGKGYVFDHLGSVLNGEAAGSAKAFHLYGEQIATPAVSASSNPVMYGYTGREHDAESGLDYHRARFRNKRTGAWLSQDLLGEMSGLLNYYSYLGSSPLSSKDPSGLLGEYEKKISDFISEQLRALIELEDSLDLARKELGKSNDPIFCESQAKTIGALTAKKVALLKEIQYSRSTYAKVKNIYNEECKGAERSPLRATLCELRVDKEVRSKFPAESWDMGLRLDL